MISGVHAVVPTAFHPDGSLDPEGVAALVQAYGDAGVDGIVVLGVMGEAPELDRDERRRVVTTARAAAAGLPVTVGLGRPGQEQADSAREAVDLGADRLLAGVAEGDAAEPALAAVTALGPPVVAQHHPAATGVRMSHERLVELVTRADVAAVKAEAPPTPDLVAALVAADGPPALGGLSAAYLLEELEAGSSGAMTGLATPEHLVTTVAAFRAGEPGRAQDAYTTMSGYLRLETMPGTVGLVVRKEAWRQRGVIGSSRVRRGAPLGAATKAAITRRLRDAGVGLVAPWPDA
jgi:4-hydroxy-tetrahydrodipicolinate synthase